MDDGLWTAAQKFVEANPKEKSLSSLITRLLSNHLRRRATRYGVKLPQSALTK